MNRILFSLVLGILVTCTACQQDSHTIHSTEDQLLRIHQTDHIEGEAEVEGSSINYLVTDDATAGTHLKVNIDGMILEATLNYNDLTIAYEGHENSLTPEQMLALNEVAIRLGNAMVPDPEESQQVEISRAENTLVRVLSHWSEAPPGHVFTHRNMQSEYAKRGDDGIQCIQRNSWYQLFYDQGSSGNATTVWRKAGYNGGSNYGCMGRCGAGCGRWWIPSSWTLDCFEHDECSRNFNASGGGSDPNCGDEWWESADDWSFGVINGCSG